jgi:monofunctional biosynthetic peptidoglycan transglycosylase
MFTLYYRIKAESDFTKFLSFLRTGKSPSARISAVLSRIGFIGGGAFVVFHLSLVLFTAVFSALLLVWNPPITSLALQRAVFDGYETQAYVYVPLKKIKPQVRRMFLILEDSAFYAHNGINITAIQNAFLRNRQLGIPLFGGSTITQQLTRTLFLNLDKSYIRKYVEAIMALTLDAILSKDRILELYLNNIEWGKGVYGIGSAAKYYYRKNLAILNIEETIRLAVIITNPIRFNVNNYAKNYGMAYRYSILVSALIPREESGPQTDSSGTSAQTP